MPMRYYFACLWIFLNFPEFTKTFSKNTFDSGKNQRLYEFANFSSNFYGKKEKRKSLVAYTPPKKYSSTWDISCPKTILNATSRNESLASHDL